MRAKAASEAAFRPITAKGFSSRCLRSRSSATAAGVARIAGEVKAAQALDRDDLAFTQPAQRFGDRVAGQRLAGGIEQAELRPAVRATGGFGMETAVGRSAVFAAHGAQSGKAARLVCARS
jgi:hypothetical protein